MEIEVSKMLTLKQIIDRKKELLGIPLTDKEYIYAFRDWLQQKNQTYVEIEKEWRAYRKNYRVCNSITTIEVIEFVQKKQKLIFDGNRGF